MKWNPAYTPGPWHVGLAADVVVYDPKGWAIANCTVFHGRQERDEAKRNAVTMALVPDLVEELHTLVWHLDAVNMARSDPMLDEVLGRAKALLARVPQKP